MYIAYCLDVNHYNDFAEVSITVMCSPNFRTPVGIVRQTVKAFKMGDSTFSLTRSQEHWSCYNNHDRLYARSLRCSRAVYEQDVIAGAIRKPVIGTKKRDPIPLVMRPNGSIIKITRIHSRRALSMRQLSIASLILRCYTS